MDFYIGLWNEDDWEKIFKNKNFKDQLTNVTRNFSEALEFSGNHLKVVKISNVPLSSIIGHRKNKYNNDDDWVDISKYSDVKKENLYNKGGMFLIDLLSVKNEVSLKLVISENE